jgi:ATP-dependent DNA helicase recQ
MYIEVKGRIEGASTFTVTANEVAFARTQQERHVLALVSVSQRGPAHDQLRYVYDAFAHIDPAVTTLSYNERWNKYWQRGTQPA